MRLPNQDAVEVDPLGIGVAAGRGETEIGCVRLVGLALVVPLSRFPLLLLRLRRRLRRRSPFIPHRGRFGSRRHSPRRHEHGATTGRDRSNPEARAHVVALKRMTESLLSALADALDGRFARTVTTLLWGVVDWRAILPMRRSLLTLPTRPELGYASQSDACHEPGNPLEP